MELRTILYGYNKKQFEYFINEDEAVIVRRVFDEYLSGKTLSQIGVGLSNERIPYYKDKTLWSKQLVRRIIENAHYIGDNEYPAIIDESIYEKANELRLEKGGNRQKDTPEIHYLKYHTRCMQCGNRYTRYNHYSGKKERWICTNGCKTPRYLDDMTFFKIIIDLVNSIILNPETITLEHREANLYKPSIKVQRDEKTLNTVISQGDLNFNSSLKAISDLLTEQFECCEMDRSYAVTDVLLEHIKKYDIIESIDIELFKTILSEIRIDKNGSVSLHLVNDAIVEHSERGDFV